MRTTGTARREERGIAATRRAISGAMLIAAALAVVLPGSALAARSSQALLTVGPATTLGSKPIVVSWHTDRAPRAGYRYRIELRIDGVGSKCRSRADAAIARLWRKGATVSVALRPNRGSGSRSRWWCTGKAPVRVVAVTGPLSASTTTLARGLLEVHDDPKSPTPTDALGLPVRVDLLDGSLMTVKVPGRPDRSAPLTGTLRGFLPGRFVPNSDLAISLTRGSITVGALAGDPLCTSNGRTYPTSVGVVGISSLTLFASGVGYLSLIPADDLLAVAGCQGPAPPAPRPVALVGKVGPTGLVRFAMSGSVGDLRLSEGVDATASLTLVIRIDLSGKN